MISIDKKLLEPFRFMGGDMYAFVSDLLKLLEEDAKGEIIYILDEIKYAKVKKAFETIRELVLENDPDAAVYLEFRDIKTCADIVVITSNLFIQDIPAFSAAISEASNIEFYPRTDEMLFMSITFGSVTTALKAKRKPLVPLDDEA